MLPDKDIGCHHTGFTRKCRELVASGECRRYIQIMGKNPNTGEDVNRWDCVDNWTPMLLIENAQQSRQTGAAVESFRNEMVNANGIVAIQQQILASAALAPPAEPKLIEGSSGA
jgi:hypothetical protein